MMRAGGGEKKKLLDFHSHFHPLPPLLSFSLFFPLLMSDSSVMGIGTLFSMESRVAF